MTHYCSLGNQLFMVAVPDAEEDIAFEFVKLGNMKYVNEHYIHSHALEFHNENEMTAHRGGLERPSAISKEREFRVKR